jgi:hypothetical protein
MFTVFIKPPDSDPNKPWSLYPCAETCLDLGHLQKRFLSWLISSLQMRLVYGN